MNRRGEKRVGARREKSPSFSKITKEMNQKHSRANNRYMYLENRWKRLHMFGKSSFLDLEPSTMIHADSVSFLTSTDDRIQKYSSMFGFSWTNPSVNSQWYIKNACFNLMWLRVYNHDLGFQLYKVCFEYSGYASHFLFHAPVL